MACALGQELTMSLEYVCNARALLFSFNDNKTGTDRLQIFLYVFVSIQMDIRSFVVEQTWVVEVRKVRNVNAARAKMFLLSLLIECRRYFKNRIADTLMEIFHAILRIHKCYGKLMFSSAYRKAFKF